MATLHTQAIINAPNAASGSLKTTSSYYRASSFRRRSTRTYYPTWRDAGNATTTTTEYQSILLSTPLATLTLLWACPS